MPNDNEDEASRRGLKGTRSASLTALVALAFVVAGAFVARLLKPGRDVMGAA